MTAQDLKQIKDLFHTEFISFRKEEREYLKAQLLSFRKEEREYLKAQLLSFRKEEREYLKAEFVTLRKELKQEIVKNLCEFTEQVLLPAVQSLIKQEIEPLARAIKGLGGITRLVTKDYCDDKQSDLRGDVLANRKKDSARLDELIRMHCQKGHITDQEVAKLEEMRGFAPLPVEV